MQNWKHPSSDTALDSDAGAEYVAMGLMCPLQQASSIEEFEPPMGTEQEGRVVGGLGICVNDVQLEDILNVYV